MSLYAESLYSASPHVSKRIVTSPTRYKRNLTISVAAAPPKRARVPAKTPSKQALLDSLYYATDQALYFYEMAEDAYREADMRSYGYESLLQKEREKTSQIAYQFREKQREIELRAHELELKSQSITQENNYLRIAADYAYRAMAGLNDEKQALQRTLQDTRDKLEAAERYARYFENLQVKFSELEGDNAKLAKTLEKCQTQLGDNDRKIVYQYYELYLQAADIATKKQQITTMNTAVKQAKDKITGKNAEIAYLQENCKKYAEYVQKARLVIKAKLGIIEQCKKDNTDLSTQLAKLDVDYYNALKNQEESSKYQEQLKYALHMRFYYQLKGYLSRQEERFYQEAEETARYLTYLRSQLAIAKREKDEAYKEADYFNAQFYMLYLQANQKAAEIYVLHANLDELRMLGSTKDKIIDDAQQKLDRINYKLTSTSSRDDYVIQLTYLRSANEELRAKLRSAISESDDKQLASYSAAVLTLKQLSARNTELQEENLKNKMEMQELQARLTRFEREDYRLKSELEVLRASNSTFTIQYYYTYDAVRQLKTELSYALDQIYQYQLGFSELQNAVLKNDYDGGVRLMMQYYKEETEQVYNYFYRAKAECDSARAQLYYNKAMLEQKEYQISKDVAQLETLQSELRCLYTSAYATTTYILDYYQQVNILNEFKRGHTDCYLVQTERDELRLRVYALDAQVYDLQSQLRVKLADRGETNAYAANTDYLAVSYLYTVASNMVYQDYAVLQASAFQSPKSQYSGTVPQNYYCNRACMHAQQNVVLQYLLKDTQDKFYELQYYVARSKLVENTDADVTTIKNAQEEFNKQIEQNKQLYQNQITRLNDQIANLMQENYELRAQKPMLENDLEQSRYLNQNYENELALKTKVLSQVQAEKAELSGNYQKEMFYNYKLLSVNKRLYQELEEALEKLNADNEVVDTFKQKLYQLGDLYALCGEQKLRIQRLEYDCESYKQETSELQSKVSGHYIVVEQLREKDNVIRQLSTAQENIYLDLDSTKYMLEQLKVDNSRYVSKVQGLSSDIIAKYKEISELQGQLLEMAELKLRLKQLDAANDQIYALSQKLTVLELENLNLTKKLNETSDEKLKLQSSNIMLINIHKEQIQNNLQLNFKLDKDNTNALLAVLYAYKQWNLYSSDVLILCDRKFISNKALYQKVVYFITDYKEGNLSSSFFRTETFFSIEEVVNFSDSLKLALKRFGVDNPQRMLYRCFYIFNLIQVLYNHLFVIRQIAELVYFPADFSRETSLVKQNYYLVLRDSKAANLLSSCHISDFVFLYQYKAAVFYKAKCCWKKCEGKIYYIIKEGLDLAKIENELQFSEPLMLERYGLLREKCLFGAEKLAEPIDFNVYYGCVCWVLLMQGCEISCATSCVGYERILGENDDQLYELCYPAVLNNGDVAGRALGVAVR